MKITSKLYLDYVNNFLSIDCFAKYHNFTKDQAVSIIARSKIAWLSESAINRKYFLNNNINLCDHYHSMTSNNKIYFSKRHTERLINEHSA